MKLFKKKNKTQSERKYYEWPTSAYLLYSKDGHNYKIIADITEEGKDMEPTVLCMAPVIYKNYQGDGYYMLAMRDKEYYPMDVVLSTRWQFNLFSSANGDGDALTMMRNEMKISRLTTRRYGIIDTPLEVVYSKDAYYHRYI